MNLPLIDLEAERRTAEDVTGRGPDPAKGPNPARPEARVNGAGAVTFR